MFWVLISSKSRNTRTILDKVDEYFLVVCNNSISHIQPVLGDIHGHLTLHSGCLDTFQSYRVVCHETAECSVVGHRLKSSHNLMDTL